MASQMSFATVDPMDFEYNTTYWFQKIHASCVQGTCFVMVNNEFEGSYPYTHKNGIVYVDHPEAHVQINLRTGDFEYDGK